MSDFKVAIFDIETTDFWADTGYMLCCCIKFVDERKLHTFRIDKYPGYNRNRTSDKNLVKDVSAILSTADVLCGWYSGPFNKKFDLPFINTRLLYYGLPLLPYDNHMDLWKIPRTRLKLRSNRLVNVERFFHLKNSKTPLDPRVWQRAVAGHARNGMNDVVTHCQADVLVTEEAYWKLAPAAYGYPNRNIITGSTTACPYCGTEDSLVKNGVRPTGTASEVQRYICKSCSASSRSAPRKRGTGARP